jgi:hypothetical protein
MDVASLTEDFGQVEVAKRLGELDPARQVSEISSLRDIFQFIPGTRIEVIVFASDPLSGARRVSRMSLTPSQQQRSFSGQPRHDAQLDLDERR